MHTYLIEPKAPLVVRSGRPFDDQSGADAARFPPPSTLAGALRTAHAESCGKPLTLELASIAVAGPLPIKLDIHGVPGMLLVPKPADALYFYTEDKKSTRVVRSMPLKLQDGEGCDLPDGLLPVQLAENIKGKPAPGPRWWSWDDLLAFRRLAAGNAVDFANLKKNGWSPLPDDVRTHVAIERKSHAAQTGKLFQTAGLCCWQNPAAKENPADNNKQPDKDEYPEGSIGMLGRIAGNIHPGVITLGGERRLSAISKVDKWPGLPVSLAAQLRKAGGLTLTLLTPGLFAEGWYPAWLNESLEGTPPGCDGLRLKLRAASMERWQAHSGWDLATHAPRAGRKLIPAGAVFWFEILSADDKALNTLWLTHLSDHEQDRRDGFGLALPHPWLPTQATHI